MSYRLSASNRTGQLVAEDLVKTEDEALFSLGVMLEYERHTSGAECIKGFIEDAETRVVILEATLDAEDGSYEVVRF
jgi:hypothetical protein